MLFSFRASACNGLGGCPVCGPVSIVEDLFIRMRCELDHHRPARYTESPIADVDDRPTESQPPLRWAAATKLDHGNGLKSVRTEVIKAGA